MSADAMPGGMPPAETPHPPVTPHLAAMVSARDFIDFPTGFAIQAAYDLDHNPKCSFIVGDGAFLCDCHAVPQRWCELREELGLPVPDRERPRPA